MTYQVAVAGASGYAGGEVLRLLADHPQLEVVAAGAHSNAGEYITAVHPHLTAYGDRRFTPTSPEAFAEADLVIMTLPHGQSAALAAQLPADQKIVDLGADHRLQDAAAWEAYYPGPHAGTWTYGLPELPGQREQIMAATRVAATGCYAVATILALRPLLDAGIVKSALEGKTLEERYTYVFNDNKQQIDHLLLTAPLADRVLDSGVVRSGRFTDGQTGPARPIDAASDHGAVWVELKVPELG